MSAVRSNPFEAEGTLGDYTLLKGIRRRCIYIFNFYFDHFCRYSDPTATRTGRLIFS